MLVVCMIWYAGIGTIITNHTTEHSIHIGISKHKVFSSFALNIIEGADESFPQFKRIGLLGRFPDRNIACTNGLVAAPLLLQDQ